MEFLGIKIDKVNLSEALEKARGFLSGNVGRKIFTPNPEMVVKARKDEYFKNVLNAGDLNLCDGFGLRLFSGAPRVPGIDFMLTLCRLAAEQGSGVYLLGSGSDAVVAKAVENLKKLFPGLKIVGWDKGPEIHENIKTLKHENNFYTDKINSARPDILFVAFGMGKQEKWIHENLPQLPSVRIAMGVGGAFDYISGAVKRAPLFLRKIGLEWLYRLFKQPKRAGRIFNATVKFIFLALKFKN